jgi:ABC-2 type transport system permease protein
LNQTAQPTQTAAKKSNSEFLFRPYVGAGINWYGAWILFSKECQRFLKVYTQSILAPVSTTLLFLAIFTLAFGDRFIGSGAVSYGEFLAPGLIMMAILQNSFANSSSSLLISKIQGNIVDLLMPPLSAGELVTCITLAGICRGLCVAISVAIGMYFFVDLSVSSPLALVFFAVAASMMMVLIGLITGVWAEKFDQMSMITNFIITPLAFLSGTFYSIDRLPGIWHDLSQWNPFFYAIDGFRYAFIGKADGNLWIGVAVLLTINIALLTVAVVMFRRGWKLKA